MGKNSRVMVRGHMAAETAGEKEKAKANKKVMEKDRDREKVAGHAEGHITNPIVPRQEEKEEA